MEWLSEEVFAERASAVERHLRRVAAKLPADSSTLEPATDTSDAIILHLWQATQIVIDLAISACVRLNLGTPANYADAFRVLATDGVIDNGLAGRLALAAGFRNTIAHAYEKLDMRRVYVAAEKGPDDLRAFLRALRDKLGDRQ